MLVLPVQSILAMSQSCCSQQLKLQTAYSASFQDPSQRWPRLLSQLWILLSLPHEYWEKKISLDLWALCSGFVATLKAGFSGEMHLSTPSTVLLSMFLWLGNCPFGKCSFSSLLPYSSRSSTAHH